MQLRISYLWNFFFFFT